jgi:hypothetical protein
VSVNKFEIGDLVRYSNQPLPIGVITKVWTGVKLTYNVTWIVQGKHVKISDTCEEAYYLQKVTHG